MGEWGETKQATVSVRLTDGSVLEGTIHLLDRVAHRTGPENPLEFMNRDEWFFALVAEDHSVHFVGKEQVALLECALSAFPPEQDEPRRRRVELDVVVAGSESVTMHGQIRLEYHPTRPRALDFLNSPSHFFALFQPDQACLISRRCTKLVRPQD